MCAQSSADFATWSIHGLGSEPERESCISLQVTIEITVRQTTNTTVLNKASQRNPNLPLSDWAQPETMSSLPAT